MIRNEYAPSAVSTPGSTLGETLDVLGMTQAELAQRTGRPVKTINEIVRGKAAITPETALQLERVLGIPAGFWQARESQYREFLIRTRESQRLKRHVDDLPRNTIRAMQTHSPDDDREREADRFAAEMLIPAAEVRRAFPNRFVRKEDVLAFAERLKVAPGIVVGRLQHEGILPPTRLNGLKRTIVLSEQERKKQH